MLAMLARCRKVGLWDVALAGFACLVSRKVGVVDGHGCGLFQKNRLWAEWRAGAGSGRLAKDCPSARRF